LRDEIFEVIEILLGKQFLPDLFHVGKVGFPSDALPEPVFVVSNVALPGGLHTLLLVVSLIYK